MKFLKISAAGIQTSESSLLEIYSVEMQAENVNLDPHKLGQSYTPQRSSERNEFVISVSTSIHIDSVSYI